MLFGLPAGVCHHQKLSCGPEASLNAAGNMAAQGFAVKMWGKRAAVDASGPSSASAGFLTGDKIVAADRGAANACQSVEMGTTKRSDAPSALRQQRCDGNEQVRTTVRLKITCPVEHYRSALSLPR